MTVTTADVVAYLGAALAAQFADVGSDPVTYSRIADALAAETLVQLGKVTYRPVTDDAPDPDNSDLENALKRRVQRNLSMQALPLAIQSTGEFGPTRVGGSDPEIRRLEAARRRTVVG